MAVGPGEEPALPVGSVTTEPATKTLSCLRRDKTQTAGRVAAACTEESTLTPAAQNQSLTPLHRPAPDHVDPKDWACRNLTPGTFQKLRVRCPGTSVLMPFHHKQPSSEVPQLNLPPASHIPGSYQPLPASDWGVRYQYYLDGHPFSFFKEYTFVKILFIYFFREGGRERERGRETSVCGCLSCAPKWGPGLQPRQVP